MLNTSPSRSTSKRCLFDSFTLDGPGGVLLAATCVVAGRSSPLGQGRRCLGAEQGTLRDELSWAVCACALSQTRTRQEEGRGPISKTRRPLPHRRRVCRLGEAHDTWCSKMISGYAKTPRRPQIRCGFGSRECQRTTTKN